MKWCINDSNINNNINDINKMTIMWKMTIND